MIICMLDMRLDMIMSKVTPLYQLYNDEILSVEMILIQESSDSGDHVS